MKLVNTILTALSIGTMIAGAQWPELKHRLNGRWEESLSASSPWGTVVLQVRDISLEGTYPDGRPLKSGLLLLFDRSSHCFFWEHSLGIERAAGFRDGLLAAYASKQHLTVFRVLPGMLTIYVWDAADKADSLDDADVKAIEMARSRVGTPQSRQWYGWHEVSLTRVLGRDFISPRDSAAPSGPLRIVSISRPEDNWEVVLDGQWKEKVTLNDRYEVVKVARMN
jgi:hypothetical protein